MTPPVADSDDYSPLAAQLDVAHLVVPTWVTELAVGRAVRPVWRNELGGITYRFGDGERYLKAQPRDTGWDVEDEVARLNWVGRHVAAPLPLRWGDRNIDGHRHDDDEDDDGKVGSRGESGGNDEVRRGGEIGGDSKVRRAGESGGGTVDRSGLRWLLTAGLPGCSAVDPAWRSRPGVAVAALGRALRRFHDEVPAASCPFSWSVADRVRRVGLDRARIGRAPAVDLVVCHGDACNPNFLLDDDGELSGYVDLGNLGIADRWADLAPALMSLGWNYGPGWEPAFLDAYGIEPDATKRTFYTDLWTAED